MKKKCVTYLRAVCLVRAICSIDKRKIIKRKGKASELKNGVGRCVFDGRKWRSKRSAPKAPATRTPSLLAPFSSPPSAIELNFTHHSFDD